MPANVESMAYYKDKPWHGLGTSITEKVTSLQMIETAGLDWRVDKRPAMGAQVSKKGIANRYELVRLPRSDKEQRVLLGLVSNRYQPLQNHQAFQFFDPIIQNENARYETAGALGQGERVWVLVKMPDVFRVVDGDECHKYLLLSNTHTGQGSVLVKFTAVRVVCQNTMILALNRGDKAYRIRHSKIMEQKLSDLSMLIQTMTDVYKEAEAAFRRMTQVQMRAERLKEYLERVYPKSKHQKAKGTIPQTWQMVGNLFDEDPTLKLKGVMGTLWAAYNAITQFEDYKQSKRSETADDRLGRVWFGRGSEIKVKAYLEALALLN